jgi:hypothetical protein
MRWNLLVARVYFRGRSSDVRYEEESPNQGLFKIVNPLDRVPSIGIALGDVRRRAGVGCSWRH